MKPLLFPEELKITPRLLAAAEAARGSRIPPGTRILALPPPTPGLTIDELLDRISIDMRNVAAVMERHPNPAIRKHGRELDGAANMARGWAKGIRADKIQP